VTEHAVVVEHVRVAFGPIRALDDVDLRVPRGSTLGVLGHNGAGKTTLIRVLTTQIRPDRGRVSIDGIDALAQPPEVRRRIGVTGQFAGLDDYLTTLENLELVARLAGLGSAARGRAQELVERFELGAVASRRAGELSGGSRRRVDLAASLVTSPRVLFLDEPSTGLDPAARKAVWDLVTELTATGTTVVLTTQYLEEADRLADHLVVLEHGRVAARGTPRDLKALVGAKVVRATVSRPHAGQLTLRPDSVAPAGEDRIAVSFSVPDDAAATEVIGRLDVDRLGVSDLEIASPTLDDVFFLLAQPGAPA
jgi:ABC-2 type transport system ATP-binding protein